MFMGSLFAQTTNQGASYYEPLWTTGIYPGNASIVFQLYIDGELQTGTNWEVGAYDMDPDAGSLVCGFAQPLEDERISPYPYYMMVYSSDGGHLIKFKLYNHDTDQETDFVAPLEISYEADGEMGNLDEFYVFNFYSQGQEMHFIGQGNWNDLENWDADRLPMALDSVISDEGAICHMPTSAIGQYATLTIEDGAQFYAPEDAEIYATVKKNIEAYTAGEGNNWYLLSLPVDFETPDFSPFNTNSAYDLFYFDQNFPGEVVDETSENGEWRNYKFYMQNGMEFKADYNGYLYANTENTTLSFTGTLYTVGSYAPRVKYNGDVDQIGISLVGNPYTCNAEMVPGGRITATYMMNEDRSDVIVYDDSDFDYTAVAPMTSFFVKSRQDHTQSKVTLTPVDLEAHEEEEPYIIRSNVSTMSIELTANGILKDRVYVKVGEGENDIKFNLSENTPKIFVPKNNKNNAIAYTEGANVMPVCFTTKQNGIYTLNFNTKNMNCSYLHLIDNVTGTDIDLFQTPSYTFNSSDSNYANRFKLVFSEEATNEIAESFAFISNGELMINNSGNATLQVMDITGRILSTENIQNCYSKSLNLSAGVYVVRLSNGNDVKTQKIVVE